MAVVEPKRTNRDQAVLAFEIAVSVVIGVMGAGVVGPILLAIIVGKIWGH